MKNAHGTTIVSVRIKDKVALGVTVKLLFSNTVLKGSANKIRRLYNNSVLAGFAGGTADAFTLFERFEAKLEKYQGHLLKSFC